MTSFGIGVYHSGLALALNSLTDGLVRKGHRKKHDVKMKAEISVMLLQVKGTRNEQKSPEARRWVQNRVSVRVSRF